MQYTIVSGILYDDKTPLASIKGTCWNMNKTICAADGSTALQVQAENTGDPEGSVQDRRYLITDAEDRPCLTAALHYAEGEDPEQDRVPLYRMPRIDRASFSYEGGEYQLLRLSSREFSLRDGSGAEQLNILHRGISGGWALTTGLAWPPEMLCSVFVFCKYIEKENEFLVV